MTPDGTDRSSTLGHQAIALPDIPAGLQDLLPTFIAEMERDTARLLQQIAATDHATALAEHVHAMRGKCAMFGETILQACLSQLELALQAGGPDRVGPLLADIATRTRQLTALTAQHKELRP